MDEQIIDHRTPDERDRTMGYVVMRSTLPRASGVAYLAAAVRSSLDSRHVVAQVAKMSSWTGAVFEHAPPMLRPTDELVIIGWEGWPEWYREPLAQLGQTSGARKPFGFDYEKAAADRAAKAPAARGRAR